MPSLRDTIEHHLVKTAATGLAATSSSSSSAVSSGSGSTTTTTEVNWLLEGCCNTNQIVLLSLVAAYSVIIFFTWRWRILLPFKLFTVYLHEFSHATAAWLTCGKVVAIEVNADEGGVTKTIGGSMWCILPAGYLGSALWGMAFIIASADPIGVQVMAGITGVGLIVVLVLADNNTLRLLVVFFMLLLGGFWACQLLTVFAGLQYLMLFIGTMNCLFAIYDCYDDLISRRANGSDAVKFAEMTHTSSRCWGIIWAIICFCFLVIGVYLGLVVGADPIVVSS